jgi:hypothetical protein
MLASMLHEHDATGPIGYAQELTGRLTAIGPGMADLDLCGAGATPLGSSTRLTAQLWFATERSFRVWGTIAVSGREVLAVATLDRGDLADASHQGIRHGTAVLEATGVGALAGVRGRITSNFVVSADGEVTDEQMVVLFLD